MDGISEAKLKEGIRYAEHILFNESSHLWLDRKFLKNHFELKNKKVLDFGCGMGGMSLWLANEFDCEVDGFDIDEHHFAVCCKLLEKYKIPNVHFERRNIIEHPTDKQYDLILLNDVIEHVKEDWIPGILKVLVDHNLKEGGVLFISYPPWEGPYASHMQRIIPIPWLQYLPQRWVLKKIRERNQPTLGRYDLLHEYLELNHMNHKKLKSFLKPFSLELIFRRSHTRINQFKMFEHVNLNFFPFKFLVTKELLAFRKV
jgi:2-polyprenyl-3-methyl-5-hydroxy-6-metoxy-1,4-benzoquinol methylase